MIDIYEDYEHAIIFSALNALRPSEQFIIGYDNDFSARLESSPCQNKC